MCNGPEVRSQDSGLLPGIGLRGSEINHGEVREFRLIALKIQGFRIGGLGLGPGILKVIPV